MSSALRKLTPEARQALCAAVESGRLAVPFTELSLRPHVQGLAGELARELGRLVSLGVTTPVLVEMLELLDGPAAPSASLVWTGPEDSAGMRDTGVVVRDMFAGAQRHVLVAGFAVYQGITIFQRLAERMDESPGLSVDLYLNIDRAYSDTSPADEIVQEFAENFRTKQWPGERLPELYYDPRALEPNEKGVKRAALHAKCVVIDRTDLLVTSANFTEAAQERNIEVGVLLSDSRMAATLVAQFEGLLAGRWLRKCGPWNEDL